MKIKVVIAEDHSLVREGFVRILKEKENCKVVGEAGDGRELLDVLSKTETDLVLLDLEMPVMKGSQALEKIKQEYPWMKIIVVSNYYDENFIAEYFLLGVNAFLPKNCDISQLFSAIDGVWKDGNYFTSDIGKKLIDKLTKEKEYKDQINKLKLNEIELVILKALCEEKTSKVIAEEVGISAYVVDHHRRSIMNKTGQSSTIGLLKFAIKNGLTSLG